MKASWPRGILTKVYSEGGVGEGFALASRARRIERRKLIESWKGETCWGGRDEPAHGHVSQLYVEPMTVRKRWRVRPSEISLR